ncbi:nucleotidyltransferase family protein [Bradyrhizobium sp.]|jgi:predicted nucleotidyltransferase|uniref:nucleotidyltransferase family protein n=1 Tax=Bradyrhizobium sp. TaxID=376 RepID=UPI003C2179B1
MRPSISVAEHRDQVREILDRAGMGNARVFGSAARGEDTDRSDLDILIDAPPGTTLYDLARVELELEALLGCKVEVLTKGFLAPDVAENVGNDLTPIP